MSSNFNKENNGKNRNSALIAQREREGLTEFKHLIKNLVLLLHLHFYGHTLTRGRTESADKKEQSRIGKTRKRGGEMRYNRYCHLD